MTLPSNTSAAESTLKFCSRDSCRSNVIYAARCEVNINQSGE